MAVEVPTAIFSVTHILLTNGKRVIGEYMGH